MTSPSSSLTGLLVVDKPGLPFAWQSGTCPLDDYDLPTSHDIVQQVRRWSGQRRIGHTGTLDPMASGVLVLCLGQATRLVEYYQGHDKGYAAEITLGAATDTYDALGAVTKTASVPELTLARIEGALARFRGQITQRPPVYSALKRGGESLHRKARRGETVQIDARPITVHELSLVDFIVPNRLRIDVYVSAGTYIRSLAHDVGEALGTVGHLSALRRTGAGPFSVEQAHDPTSIKAAGRQLQPLLLPPGWGLALPKLTLDGTMAERLGYGQKVWLTHGNPMPETLAQAVDTCGRFLGIMRCLEISADQTAALWKAEKWFAAGM